MTVQLFVGAGGWSYFQKGPDRLAQYAKYLKTVEINSTYYWQMDPRTAQKWRRTVGPAFMFTVRCHRNIAERFQFSQTKEAETQFLDILRTCKVLDAQVLHVLVPAAVCDDSLRHRICDFLSAFSLSGVNIAVELRGEVTPAMGTKLFDTLADLGVIHCVDLLREKPFYRHTVMYSRIFGKGWHNLYQPDDSDLAALHDSVNQSGVQRFYTIFHTLKMYTDAQRFQFYHGSGRFAPVTRFVGVESALSVLAEDVVFPTTLGRLIAEQGWKLCDWKEGKRVRLGVILSELPRREVKDIADLKTVLAEASLSKHP